jgi:hypothetical protein
MGNRTFKPFKLRHIPDSQWDVMTEDERQRLVLGVQGAAMIASANGTAVAEQPALDLPEAKPLEDIRDWNEEVDGISGERLRNCIIYQLDVRKKDWWVKNMSIAHVRRNAKALDEETPPGWAPKSADTLIVERTQRIDGEDVTIYEINRDPKNDEERQRIRKRFGVNSVTIKRLTKKDCKKCNGTGYYAQSSYPGQGCLEKLSDTVTCECVFE